MLMAFNTSIKLTRLMKKKTLQADKSINVTLRNCIHLHIYSSKKY